MSMQSTMPPRERMWRAARCIQVFSAEDLQVLGTTTISEAKAFIGCLVRRGYAQQSGSETRPRRGRPLAKFRLLKNPGSRLPAELKGHADRGLV